MVVLFIVIVGVYLIFGYNIYQNTYKNCLNTEEQIGVVSLKGTIILDWIPMVLKIRKIKILVESKTEDDEEVVNTTIDYFSQLYTGHSQLGADIFAETILKTFAQA